jgi:hypothetical protein
VHLSSQATEEAEIFNIMVSRSPLAKKKKKKFASHHINRKKMGMVVKAYHSSYFRKHKRGGSRGRGQPGQKEKSYP